MNWLVDHLQLDRTILKTRILFAALLIVFAVLFAVGTFPLRQPNADLGMAILLVFFAVFIFFLGAGNPGRKQ